MKHIVLFGGSFNPPHLGHLLVTNQAFELIPDISQVWLLPAHLHTFEKTLAPSAMRLAMTKLLLQSLPQTVAQKTKVCSLEIDRKMSGQTYETLQMLKHDSEYLVKSGLLTAEEAQEEITFSFLMGSDQLPTFTKWGQWESLLNEMHFFVYPRAGYDHTIHFKNMTLLQSPTQVITNFSSTLVRTRIKNNLSLDHIVPKVLQEFIFTNELYGEE